MYMFISWVCMLVSQEKAHAHDFGFRTQKVEDVKSDAITLIWKTLQRHKSFKGTNMCIFLRMQA